MSGEIWFLFLMVGLKLPVLGIGYFFYRVFRWQEHEWEDLGGNADPPDSDGGDGRGGSKNRPPRAPRPRSGPARMRGPERRPLRTATGRRLVPRTRSGTSSTRLPMATVSPSEEDATSERSPLRHRALVVRQRP
jgi:hypothetical protein